MYLNLKVDLCGVDPKKEPEIICCYSYRFIILEWIILRWIFKFESRWCLRIWSNFFYYLYLLKYLNFIIRSVFFVFFLHQIINMNREILILVSPRSSSFTFPSYQIKLYGELLGISSEMRIETSQTMGNPVSFMDQTK